MYTIAVVEDEKDLANLVVKYLEAEGYKVILYNTGDEVKVTSDVDLWILDIMLPGLTSGYDLIKKIKSLDSRKPVIFTSARSQDIDRIMGLELGSDDYLSKPYSIRELILRVGKLLGRTYNTKSGKTFIRLGCYLLDTEHRSVLEGEKNIRLTSKEYDFLYFLATNALKPFSREQILNAVWGDDYFGSDRVVDDLLRRLRQKLPKINIETIYGYGYRLLV